MSKDTKNVIELYNVHFWNSLKDIVMERDVQEELAVIGIRACGNLDNGEKVCTSWIERFWKEDTVTFFECSGRTFKAVSYA